MAGPEPAIYALPCNIQPTVMRARALADCGMTSLDARRPARGMMLRRPPQMPKALYLAQKIQGLAQKIQDFPQHPRIFSATVAVVGVLTARPSLYPAAAGTEAANDRAR